MSKDKKKRETNEKTNEVPSAEKKKNKFLQELISFLQSKGYVWGPSPEIYGGTAGFYTYGPLGKLLKNKVENIIRKTFQEQEFFEVECPIIMERKVVFILNSIFLSHINQFLAHMLQNRSSEWFSMNKI